MSEQRAHAATNPDPLLTVAEAADFANVSKTFIYRATSEGQLGTVRLGRAVRIRRSTLETFLRDLETRATA